MSRHKFPPVDLMTADLEIVSSIYEGWSTAIMVKGEPRTIALFREYADAVQAMAMLAAGRAALETPDA